MILYNDIVYGLILSSQNIIYLPSVQQILNNADFFQYESWLGGNFYDLLCVNYYDHYFSFENTREFISILIKILLSTNQIFTHSENLHPILRNMAPGVKWQCTITHCVPSHSTLFLFQTIGRQSIYKNKTKNW